MAVTSTVTEPGWLKQRYAAYGSAKKPQGRFHPLSRINYRSFNPQHPMPEKNLPRMRRLFQNTEMNRR
jgi:hypothetical protein